MIGPEIPENIKRIRDVRLGRVGKINAEKSRGMFSSVGPDAGSKSAGGVLGQDGPNDLESESESESDDSFGPIPVDINNDSEEEEIQAQERLAKNASQDMPASQSDERNDWMAHALGFKSSGKRDNDGNSGPNGLASSKKKHKSSGIEWTKVAVETKNPSLTLQAKSGNVTVDAASSIKGRFRK